MLQTKRQLGSEDPVLKLRTLGSLVEDSCSITLTEPVWQELRYAPHEQSAVKSDLVACTRGSYWQKRRKRQES
jgi:hypothetical protein